MYGNGIKTRLDRIVADVVCRIVDSSLFVCQDAGFVSPPPSLLLLLPLSLRLSRSSFVISHARSVHLAVINCIGCRC